MRPILAISDLHPEKGFNRQLYDLLWKYSETHTVVFVGDCLQYPSSYRKVPHRNIQGNHDSGKCRDEYWALDGIVFVHSHQWDPEADTGGKITDSIWSFFQHTFKSRDLTMGGTQVVHTLDYMVKKPMADAEYSRVRNTIIPAVRERYGNLRMLVMGHRHTRYARVIGDVTAINCGAGWKGEFVTIDSSGVRFHSFK